jgi:hypothetical protein
VRPLIRTAAAVALASAWIVAATAQVAPPPPPPPPGPDYGTRPGSAASDADLEPQVTIIRRETETIEEVRIGGEIKFVKVTPRHGVPYYLVPDGNGRNFVKRDSLDTSLKVPMWVLFSW